MRRKDRFERLGNFFESIGKAVERPASQGRDPVTYNVRQACKGLIALSIFFGVVAIDNFFRRNNPWALLVLSFDIAVIVVAVRAMKTPQPVKSFLWLLVAIALLVLTVTVFALLAPYA